MSGVWDDELTVHAQTALFPYLAKSCWLKKVLAISVADGDFELFLSVCSSVSLYRVFGVGQMMKYQVVGVTSRSLWCQLRKVAPKYSDWHTSQGFTSPILATCSFLKEPSAIQRRGNPTLCSNHYRHASWRDTGIPFMGCSVWDSGVSHTRQSWTAACNSNERLLGRRHQASRETTFPASYLRVVEMGLL